MKQIQAGLRAREVVFDPENECLIPPTIWEIKGGYGRNFVIHVHSQGWSEQGLRYYLGWTDVDEEFDTPRDRATFRYFKKHSIRELLVGDNPDISVEAIEVDDCGFLLADLNIGKLKICNQICLNCAWIEIIYDIVIWNELGQAIERYSIRCPDDSNDTFITVFDNNGKSIDKWPIKEEIQIIAPKTDD